jgi:hypothetical protein
MADFRHWHTACLIFRMSKIARLFAIKTRTEVWFVIYAIALGAVERGRAYIDAYPGYGGWLLALACTAVVFLVGARLLDTVEPKTAGVAMARLSAPRGQVIRNRPTRRRQPSGSTSPLSPGTGSRPARPPFGRRVSSRADRTRNPHP